MELGNQFEVYSSSLESNFHHRLSISSDYLYACNNANATACHDGTGVTSAFVGSIREEQEICVCNNAASTYELYGTNATIPGSATITDVKNAIQSIASVGQVSVASATAGTCCGAASVNFKITYDSIEGDVPLPLIVPVGSSSARENVKGLH